MGKAAEFRHQFKSAHVPQNGYCPPPTRLWLAVAGENPSLAIWTIGLLWQGGASTSPDRICGLEQGGCTKCPFRVARRQLQSPNSAYTAWNRFRGILSLAQAGNTQRGVGVATLSRLYSDWKALFGTIP